MVDLEKVKVSKDYQSLEYDVEANMFSYGIVRTTDQLEPGNFISEIDINGNHFLISNFGEDEYYCTGTCSCEEPVATDENERRNSYIFTRPVIYLVAALSSFAAIEKSTTHFRSDCENFYKDDCHSHAIKSEVNECQEVGEVENKEKKKKTATTTDEHVEAEDDGSYAVIEEEDGSKIKFMCSGSCGLEELLIIRYEFEIQQWTKDERTRELCRHQNILNFFPHDKVPFPVQTYNLWNENCMDIELHGEVKVDKNLPDPQKAAKEQFENEILLPYCISESDVAGIEMTTLFMKENLPEYKKGHVCELGETGCRKVV